MPSIPGQGISPADPLRSILSRLKNAKPSGEGYSARCPGHQDHHNSLSICKGSDGSALVKCHAGCKTEDVLWAIGLSLADLYPNQGNNKRNKPPKQQNGKHREEGGDYPPEKASTGQQFSELSGSNSCTLTMYGAAKCLPVSFLHALGLADMSYMSSPAVRIPHFGLDGSEVGVCYRTALYKSQEGDNRIRWRAGQKKVLYGLDRLQAARDAGYIALVEGQSDCHTLWYHGEPALGLPGAGSWREEWSAYLDDIPTIYVVIEPDKGGEAVRTWLAKSPLRDRIRLVELGDSKDPSGLYLTTPLGDFISTWKAALEAATPWVDLERAEKEAKAREAWALCQKLAQEDDILSRFAETLERRGLAGESRAAKLLYLCSTSRLTDEPVSAAVKGPSSAGKSHVVEEVLDFFPQEAYYALSAMSERSLAYSDEPLSHRFMVVYEAAGLTSEFASYLMRSLLSEGRLRYATVEKTRDGLRPRLIEREGPTGLIVTTTAASLHPENETRMLSFAITDTPQQTRRVLLALARENSNEDEEDCLTEWHALQEWLAYSEHRVTIPYAQALAERTSDTAVRLRRDFGKVLILIQAHAILHQAKRRRDSRGRIVAELSDYEAVRNLVADLIAEGVGATVLQSVRDTVQAVSDLGTAQGTPVSQAQIAARLKLDKGAVSRRVNVCLDHGYLRNLETQKGRPAKLEIGDPLPEEVEILPAPALLTADASTPDGDCCTVDASRPEIPIPPSLTPKLPQPAGGSVAVSKIGRAGYEGRRPATRQEIAATLSQWEQSSLFEGIDEAEIARALSRKPTFPGGSPPC